MYFGTLVSVFADSLWQHDTLDGAAMIVGRTNYLLIMGADLSTRRDSRRWDMASANLRRHEHRGKFSDSEFEAAKIMVE